MTKLTEAAALALFPVGQKVTYPHKTDENVKVKAVITGFNVERQLYTMNKEPDGTPIFRSSVNLKKSQGRPVGTKLENGKKAAPKAQTSQAPEEIEANAMDSEEFDVAINGLMQMTEIYSANNAKMAEMQEEQVGLVEAMGELIARLQQHRASLDIEAVEEQPSDEEEAAPPPAKKARPAVSFVKPMKSKADASEE